MDARDTNPRRMMHATWHYGGEFLRMAYAQAGKPKVRREVMDQAREYYRQHADVLDPMTTLVNELSDGLLDLNWSYEVVPLGKWNDWKEMVEHVREAYGATIAHEICCVGEIIESEWINQEEPDRGLPHVITAVWCYGRAYPMLVTGVKRRPKLDE